MTKFKVTNSVLDLVIGLVIVLVIGLVIVLVIGENDRFKLVPPERQVHNYLI